jgi:DNA-binding transcriptional MerR regulator
MRIGELSRRTQLPIATIKYYQREGLLPPGERTRPNQVGYGELHVLRIRLVRALTEVAGLSIAAIRELLAVMDTPDIPVHQVLGAAQRSLPSAPEPSNDQRWSAALREIAELVDRRGWRVNPNNPGLRAAATVLVTWRELSGDNRAGLLDGYADGVERIAAADLAAVRERGNLEDMVQVVVVGTLLGDTLIAALRRLAQEDASARLFTTGPGIHPVPAPSDPDHAAVDPCSPT